MAPFIKVKETLGRQVDGAGPERPACSPPSGDGDFLHEHTQVGLEGSEKMRKHPVCLVKWGTQACFQQSARQSMPKQREAGSPQHSTHQRLLHKNRMKPISIFQMSSSAATRIHKGTFLVEERKHHWTS